MSFMNSRVEPRKEGLHLEWRAIDYEVELSDVAAKAQTPAGGVPQRVKRILFEVSAQAPSNTLMAVMVCDITVILAFPLRAWRADRVCCQPLSELQAHTFPAACDVDTSVPPTAGAVGQWEDVHAPHPVQPSQPDWCDELRASI